MSPTPEQVQRFIAELLGFRRVWVCVPEGETGGPMYKAWAPDAKRLYKSPDGKNDTFEFTTLPYWPGDRNASYELLHKMNAEDTRDAEVVAQKHYRFILATHPAIEECLIWILYKGYKWVECDNFDCLEQINDYKNCPCKGEGGKFVKV